MTSSPLKTISIAQPFDLESSTILTTAVAIPAIGTNIVTTEPIVTSSTLPTESSSSNLSNSLTSSSSQTVTATSAVLATTSQGKTLSTTSVSTTTNPKMSIGMNLAGVSYYSPENPFINAFKSASSWYTITIDSSGNIINYNTGEESKLSLDSNGWVTTLAGTHTYNAISVTLFRGQNGNYPGGQYVVSYQGSGTIEFPSTLYGEPNDAKFVSQTTSTVNGVVTTTDLINVNPSPSSLGINIVITADNPTNYIKNISVVPVQYKNTYQTSPFNPAFTSKIQPFGTLRFMDWMNTNNNLTPVNSLSDGATPNTATYESTGVSVQTMVALANQTQSNVWFNMPTEATNQYVTQFAQYVKANLDPGLKIYVEYSNEVWNNGFSQAGYAQQQGLAEFPNLNDNANDRYIAQLDWYTQRTQQVVGIWDQVFAGDTSNQVLGVLGGQSSNLYVGQTEINYAKSTSAGLQGINVLAIAPYFGYYLSTPGNSKYVQYWSLNQLFQELTEGGVLPGGPAGGALQQTESQIASYATLAKQNGLQLGAYEGGESLVASGSGLSSGGQTQLFNLFSQASQDPRMGAIYQQLLQYWNQVGGGVFNAFNDVTQNSIYGDWGALQNLSQTSTPKYNALVQASQKPNA